MHAIRNVSYQCDKTLVCEGRTASAAVPPSNRQCLQCTAAFLLVLAQTESVHEYAVSTGRATHWPHDCALTHSLTHSLTHWPPMGNPPSSARRPTDLGTMQYSSTMWCRGFRTCSSATDFWRSAMSDSTDTCHGNDRLMCLRRRNPPSRAHFHCSRPHTVLPLTAACNGPQTHEGSAERYSPPFGVAS
jgi:hypothetical protein